MVELRDTMFFPRLRPVSPRAPHLGSGRQALLPPVPPQRARAIMIRCDSKDIQTMRVKKSCHIQIVQPREKRTPAKVSFECSRILHLGRYCVWSRSEEHTSELQSLAYLVCRLLLEK